MEADRHACVALVSPPPTRCRTPSAARPACF